MLLSDYLLDRNSVLTHRAFRTACNQFSILADVFRQAHASSYIGGLGELDRVIDFDFDFDFDSFVRGVRAGEAKLRAGTRDVILLSLGLSTESSRPPRWVRRHVGFKRFNAFIDGSRCVFSAQARGF